jgi:hypothetical protein
MRTHRLGKISKLQQLCDKAISKLIREKGFCEKCGTKNSDFDTAHVVGRKNLTLRWDILNLLCLCRDCHRWGHAHPKEFRKWFDNKYPERSEYVDSVKNRIIWKSVLDYEELLDNIEKKNFGSLITPYESVS